jgi:predicted adenine nucleotide alpha hydrolase (AANH) superfamily ATPase
MYSNFITPPDYVKTVLVLNAVPDQITNLNVAVQNSRQLYNVYFYNDNMNQLEWLERVKRQADIVVDATITNLEEYFNK